MARTSVVVEQGGRGLLSTVVDQSTHPSPPALRLRRPGWRDPRLLVGVLLVAASVSLGSWLMTAAGHTTQVYAADGPLVPGEVVDPAHLVVQDVRLPGTAGAYLTPDDLAEDLVAVRTVGDGELVPVSALARADAVGVRPVAVTPDGALSSGVVEGSLVDLWFVADPVDQGGRATAGDPAPRLLSSGLTVAEVVEPDGAFSVGSRATVQVLVPTTDLPGVLQALADDGSVQVVAVPGSVRRP
ncbi:MAG TPA: hypothetical protein VGK35_00585 [Actinotalea sp.]